MRILSITSALALAIIDICYVLRGAISFIYLGDAAIELLFIAGWLMLLFRNSPGSAR